MSSPSHRRSTDSFQSPLASPSPRTEYPFPNYDWSSRGVPSSRYPARRGSNASTVSFSSIGGSLDIAADRRRNTVVETGQNAISNLLIPPILRTGLSTAVHSTSHKPPTSKDIPPVTLTNIPHIESSAFREYLSQVGGLFDAFQRAKSDSESGGAQLFRRDRGTAKDDEFAEIIERRARKDSTSSVSGPRPSTAGLLSPVESPGARRRSSGGISKRGPPAPTPLSTIPSVYFEESFRLENPRTFDIVSERSEVVQQPRPATDESKGANGSANGAPPAARKALATNAILQEKLSWYMDTVEIHLISSISQASSSFFAALGSLRELQGEAADSVAKIQRLRGDLARLDEEMAAGGLEIINMKRRRDNLQSLGEATEQLQCVVSGANHCEELVDSGDFDKAIEHIGSVERLACGSLEMNPAQDVSWLLPNPSLRLVDLRRLNALEGLSKGIDQLRFRIGKGFEARLLEVLLGDIRRHVSSVPPRDTLSRWANTSKRTRGAHTRGSSVLPAYMITSEKLREDLVGVLQGLGRSRYLAQASAAFREAVIREMKKIIQQNLPSSTDDDIESVASASTRASSRRTTQQEKSSILSRNLRALDPESAEELFAKTYCAIGEAIRRLGVQVKVLLDVTSGMKRSTTDPLSPLKSPGIGAGKQLHASTSSGNLQEELSQALDMSSLLGQAVDKAQSEMTKVLKVRNEQTIRLSIPDFLRYFTINRLFADECEAVSGRSGASLKGVVNNQIHDFLPLMRDSENQKLAQAMESDKWETADFKPEESAILARILQSMTSDPPDWLKYTDAAIALELNGASDAQTNGAPVEEAAKSNGTSKKEMRPAFIEEEKFMLVESSAFALRGVERYGILIAGIPSMVSEVSTALLDYLKIFNSRTQQLILGAGATKTAGLSNINTKHLALASQSLSFFIALIPYLREFVRRRPSISSSSLAEYDRVRRLFQDHQASIHEKLIDIMSTRATVHIKSMAKIDFDSDTERQVSPHMETLTRETTLLHRVLGKYLPDMTVRMIMGPVFSSYRDQWSKAFSDVAIKSDTGKARLLRDAELLDSRLGKIEGAGDIGAYLIGIVNSKVVISVKPAPKADTVDVKSRKTSPAAEQQQQASGNEKKEVG
ncbi:GARP complex component [Rhizodiscina lignyota]|uniref:Vacuolar protein sorting-associated protein 54 n=1 Tax=Rhizodiscina lignyota TaxID=1504668 RepID=A0A9P4IB66_9PEZI|nr:GARP complex component [Rhizodiscina lignyota]